MTEEDSLEAAEALERESRDLSHQAEQMKKRVIANCAHEHLEWCVDNYQGCSIVLRCETCRQYAEFSCKENSYSSSSKAAVRFIEAIRHRFKQDTGVECTGEVQRMMDTAVKRAQQHSFESGFMAGMAKAVEQLKSEEEPDWARGAYDFARIAAAEYMGEGKKAEEH